MSKLEGCINAEDHELVKQFLIVALNKRTSRVKGVLVPFDQKEQANKRSEVWLNFLRSIWQNSGFFDPSNPFNVFTTEVKFEVILTMLSKQVYNQVFFGVESFTCNGEEISFLSLKSLYLITYFVLLMYFNNYIIYIYIYIINNNLKIN